MRQHRRQAPAGAPRSVDALALNGRAMRRGDGRTLAEFALTDAQRKMVCEDQGIGLLERKRMGAEVWLRQKLGTVLSEASLRTLFITV